MRIPALGLLAAFLLFGCSSRDGGGADLGGGPTDLGVGADAGAADGGLADGATGDGAVIDGGATDGGVGDAGATVDGAIGDASTGVDAGSGGLCVGDTGLACGDTADGGTCPAGYDCNLGRCIPQARETCGGFAGAMCPVTGHTDCLMETGHGDVGTCFTPAEHACLCSVAASSWSC